MKLSIVIPVWNEKNTIDEIIKRVENSVVPNWQTEIILVDDFSTDGTREILKKYENRHTVVYHSKNQGKGSAVNTGLSSVTGDYILIQDADLEYDPADYAGLVGAIAGVPKRAVYGSRNIGTKARRGKLIPRLGVAFLTHEFNFLFGTRLTDLWTCYKLFPTEAKSFFKAGRFESELSFSAALIKNRFHIVEVPISYNPRPSNQGKKIRYRDGIMGIWTILKERFTK